MNENPSDEQERGIPQSPATDYQPVASERLTETYAHIDRLRERLDALKRAHPHLWPNIFKKQNVAWTAETNAIEGSSLSFSDTLFFLEEGLTVQGKPLKDFLDARNHSEAIDLLYQCIADERPMTPGFLKELNALLLAGVTHTSAIDLVGRPLRKPARPGQYKELPNNVLMPDGSLKAYIDPVHVAAEIDRLCAWIDADNLHPIAKAALAHYNFVTIHPFDDGNGRGARILMNLLLIKSGYPPAVINNSERAAYLDALRYGQAGGGVEPFVFFIAATLARTIDAMIADFEANK